ncbi:MAG TPA: hypothetical protein VK801_13205 [Caulobacteraceae bacterium]|jgi:hypothetical protein|nr:hypothetical protein [Caulobacteraceae bacterium]
MSPAHEPPDPPEPPQGVRLLSRPFWILMVFAAACLAAAMVVAFAGPSLFPKAAPSAAHPPAPLATGARNGRETP